MTAPVRSSIAPPSESAQDASARYITFALAEEQFAFPILRVQEVRIFARATRVPRAPKYVLGVMSVRGAVVPVVDLRTRFDLPRREHAEAPVAMIVQVRSKAQERAMAVVVDELLSVTTFADSELAPVPHVSRDAAGEYASGIVQTEDDLVTVLDIDALLNSRELAPLLDTRG